MKISFLGIGLMGLPMAQRLIDAHYSLTVYNRTSSKLDSLQAGATIAPSATAAIAASDCVILMLTDASAIRELLLSDSSRSQLAGRTVVQMGTISPTESQVIRDEVVAAGGDYLEAPVLGSIPEARSGSLIVMVGAEPDQFAQWAALLATFGSDPVLLGSVGSAAAVKLALNQLIGSLTSAFAVSLGLVMRQGVDPDSFMKILRKSALYAPTFDKKLQRMLDRDYQTPNFPTKHLKKDIELFISAARSSGLETDGVEGVHQILTKAMSMSFAEMDYAALFSAICFADSAGVDPLSGEEVI
ncbi:MAG: NAD(P)-dependent oxidoreductase [Phormidesmis sp. CAN_BIN36]|nr:NAD(P)-dependent oxidoreductase [Phormidesmis sp. CAN_BIN36]